MQIGAVAQHSGVPAKTIRYYEQIGILPPPAWANNNYRHYRPEVLERLRFVASAHSLGFTLTEIAEILAVPGQGVAPCNRVLEVLDIQLATLDQLMIAVAAQRRIAELQHTGVIAFDTWQELALDLEAAITTSRAAQQALLAEHPTLRDTEVEAARREGLRAQRATLSTLLSDGAISEPIYQELITAVDAALAGNGITEALGSKE